MGIYMKTLTLACSSIQGQKLVCQTNRGMVQPMVFVPTYGHLYLSSWRRIHIRLSSLVSGWIMDGVVSMVTFISHLEMFHPLVHLKSPKSLREDIWRMKFIPLLLKVMKYVGMMNQFYSYPLLPGLIKYMNYGEKL